MLRQPTFLRQECIASKNKKAPGYAKKVEWFKSRLNKGLKIKIAIDEEGKQLGFIEYIPSESAWRPVKADNYYFIHCIGLFAKEARHRNIGTTLLQMCEEEAKQNDKDGVCVMSSNGAWMANKTLFEKNGFAIIDQLGRFELMCKKIKIKAGDPCFIDWTKKQVDYKGWNLIYSDQCPWHEKSVADLKQSALEHGINLKVTKLNTPEEAQNAPSGFGTFSLIKDGKLIEDHYLSKTRFENILKKEL
ncbi:MAG: GNAT family N-acetyltransferase [Candidatus Stygibacter frigidus]|nr:GNAT family N-acetyltransferase [Candidatus Stygibacter frigidus]